MPVVSIRRPLFLSRVTGRTDRRQKCTAGWGGASTSRRARPGCARSSLPGLRLLPSKSARSPLRACPYDRRLTFHLPTSLPLASRPISVDTAPATGGATGVCIG